MTGPQEQDGTPRPGDAGATCASVEWAVDAADTSIWIDEQCVLHVCARNEEHIDVRPRKVFPLSEKAAYITFLGEKNKEMLLLRNPDALDPASREALDKALGLVYYVAKIRSVQHIEEAMGVSLWDVETDCGFARFEISDRNRQIRTLSPGRYQIADVDGNRFEIEDVKQLDARSQRLVATET